MRTAQALCAPVLVDAEANVPQVLVHAHQLAAHQLVQRPLLCCG